MPEKYSKIKEIENCINLLQTGSIQEIADLFNTIWKKEEQEFASGYYYNEYIFSYSIADMIWIYAFDNDNIELLDALDLEFLSSVYRDTIKERIIKAIVSHQHTEILIHIFESFSISESDENELYVAAVFSENIPVIKAIKDGCITVEIVESLIENEKYGLIDTIFYNGAFIKDSKVIKNYFCSAVTSNNKFYLERMEWFAERYMPSYNEYDNKEQATIEFVKQNADIPELINAVYDQLNRIPFVFDYLLKLDVKTQDITNIITSYIANPAERFFIQDCDILYYTIQFISENSYIKYDIFTSNLAYSGNYSSELKRIMKKINDNNIKPHLILNSDYNRKTKKSDLITLLKHCSVHIEGEPNENPIIQQLVNDDDSKIIDILCKVNAIDADNMDKMIDMCVASKSLKCLDTITKWYMKQVS